MPKKTEKTAFGAPTPTRRKYTPAFKAEGVRQVAAGIRQSDVARAQGTSAALLGTWQRQALAAAQAAFTRHAGRYGTRRLRAGLQAEGHAVGRYALRTWLRATGLRALSTRPQRPRTTVADPAALVAENRLLGQPAPTAPDRVWWATSPACRSWAAAGATWPPGATPAPGAWWAGTWPRTCPPNWS